MRERDFEINKTVFRAYGAFSCYLITCALSRAKRKILPFSILLFFTRQQAGNEKKALHVS
ncbi:MAG TPA: hypothetical protein DDY77_05665 [Clostridiales bacterium]|nr:hypothetical protein [Clostridiales bacterium]